MSQKLIEILKKNSQDIENLRNDLDELKKKIEKIDDIDKQVNVQAKLVKDISLKSFYIEKYLENIQNTEIEEVLNDEFLLNND